MLTDETQKGFCLNVNYAMNFFICLMVNILQIDSCLVLQQKSQIVQARS